MESIRQTYSWCPTCERRIADQLFKAGKCPGCHDDAKRNIIRKSKEYTEEEYLNMGVVTHVAEEYD